ncbi:hypothetical protein L3556_14210 [Candidatus Synechococcus calcipolaris G9]|uniref:Uncharacterized protein n=1 Tax=Candidatus Synechococcus calcipolaris G9 TaxID=1497997 RepID=A0ABT6F2N6_9SYNE|nr:hypothetical protein [Candidatus Synechococcus calcipolaris]MDG2992075.1 hypothetical protein [Candidatus Synechococcus calcipolaris G9]
MSVKQQLLIGLSLVSLGCLCVPSSALAQTAGAGTPNPMEGWQQNNTSNDLSNVLNNGSGGPSFSMPGLINQMRLLDGRDVNEVTADQMENLNSQAELFRQQQQQQFQGTSTSTAP